MSKPHLAVTILCSAYDMSKPHLAVTILCSAYGMSKPHLAVTILCSASGMSNGGVFKLEYPLQQHCIGKCADSAIRLSQRLC